MAANFPTADRNHRISAESKTVLDARRPSSWMLQSLDGDDDFGFDFNIQFAPDGQVAHVFRAQLKGTESPNVLVDGETISVALKRTTMNFYAGTAEPVLLVVCVIAWGKNDRADTSASKLYYLWLDDELRRLRGSRYALDETNGGTVTVRVPTSNSLTPDFDAGPHLRKQIERARATETLEDVAEAAAQNLSRARGMPLEVLSNRLSDNPDMVAHLLSVDEPETWIQPAPGSAQQKLNDIAGHIRSSHTTIAQDLLARFDRSLLVSPQLQADHTCMLGKVLMQRMDKQAALEKFQAAFLLSQQEKYLLPLVETKLLIHRDDANSKWTLAELADELKQSKSPEGLALRSRILNLAGDYQGAEQVIELIPEERRLIPTLISLLVRKQWDQLIDVGTAATKSMVLSPEDDGVRLMLLARACWSKACASANLDEFEAEIPLLGPRGLDLGMASRSWSFAKACLRRFKELSWPANVLLVGDIAVTSAYVAGEGSEALALLKDAGAARPEFISLQEHLEVIAMQMGDFTTALEANSRQPDSPQVQVRRATQHFNAAQYQECIAASTNVLNDHDVSYYQTPLAIACGYAAALRATRPQLRIDFERLLESRPEWAEFLWFARVLGIIAIDRTNANEATATLKEGLKHCPNSRLLATNLFTNTSTDSPERAAQVVDLAKLIRAQMLLTHRDSVHLIAALLTLGDWTKAEFEGRAAIARFGKLGDVVSLLAVSLEMQGHTSQAFDLLDGLVSSEAARYQALRNFLGITLRLGKLEKARECLDRLLAKYSNNRERIDWIRLRILVAVQLHESDDVTLGLLDEIATAVDHDNEDQAAMYLNLFIASTLQMTDSTGLSQRASVFQERVDNFSAHWPQSKLFRRLSVDTNAASNDIHEVLSSIIGSDSRARLREYERREQQIKSGDLPVPFIARPGFALHYVSECFSLWELAKSSKSEERQVHLVTYLADEPEFESVRALRDMPLLDITSLLVLQDLNLFELLLKLYPRVAIPRRTVDFISQYSRGSLVPRVASVRASNLLIFINGYLERIDQPGTSNVMLKAQGGIDVLEDYWRVADRGSWVIFSDDAYTRGALQSKDKRNCVHMNTVGFLHLAASQGLIEPYEVAEHLGKLCSWNVGVQVQNRYLIAALPRTLPANVLSTSDRLEAFQNHSTFCTIARAVWHFGQTETNLVIHMGYLLVSMLSNASSSVESAAAVWAFWYLRVRQNPSWPADSQDLLCYSFVLAVVDLPQQAMTRLAQAYFAVIELEAGKAMSGSHEHAAIARIGGLVADLASRDRSREDILRGKLSGAFSPGTAAGDSFEFGFVEANRKRVKANAAQVR